VSTPRLKIRRAEPADASAAGALFAVRNSSEAPSTDDGRGPDLGNPRRRLWLAFEGERAVAMTSVQERELRLDGEHHRVAYWTGLFVDPAYRQFMIYPQLLLAMFAGLRQSGIRHLYAAVRRQQVAEGHLKVGFRKIGDLAVLAKPLRPARFWVRYRQGARKRHAQPWLLALCRVPDALAGTLVRLQGLGQVGNAAEIPWASPAVAEVAELYDAACTGCAMQHWTPELLRSRYGQEHSPYRLFGVRRDGRLLAAVITRLVTRPDGIHAAIIMDLVHAPQVPGAAGAAMAAVERLALAGDCDVVLLLEATSPGDARVARRRGYLKSPEKYSLLLWTDRGAGPEPFSLERHAWRFAFGDHDTF
jgi:hypothetical protein